MFPSRIGAASVGIPNGGSGWVSLWVSIRNHVQSPAHGLFLVPQPHCPCLRWYSERRLRMASLWISIRNHIQRRSRAQAKAHTARHRGGASALMGYNTELRREAAKQIDCSQRGCGAAPCAHVVPHCDPPGGSSRSPHCCHGAWTSFAKAPLPSKREQRRSPCACALNP